MPRTKPIKRKIAHDRAATCTKKMYQLDMIVDDDEFACKNCIKSLLSFSFVAL